MTRNKLVNTEGKCTELNYLENRKMYVFKTVGFQKILPFFSSSFFSDNLCDALPFLVSLSFFLAVLVAYSWALHPPHNNDPLVTRCDLWMYSPLLFFLWQHTLFSSTYQPEQIWFTYVYIRTTYLDHESKSK